MSSDLHGLVSALLDLWQRSQRKVAKQAEHQRNADAGEWLTGVEDDGAVKISQLEDVLRGRGLPQGATYHAGGEAESLPRFDPEAAREHGRWYYPDPPEGA